MPKKGEKARKVKKLKAGQGVRPPKRWWDELMGALKGEKKYKGYSEKRLKRIAGGTWSKKPKAAKIKIVKKWQI